jgi:hypothetical protein
MLLKGTEEMKFCERPDTILEMLLVRIVYASGLPELNDLIGRLEKKTSSPIAKNEKIPDIKSVDLSGSLADEVLKMFPDARTE